MSRAELNGPILDALKHLSTQMAAEFADVKQRLTNVEVRLTNVEVRLTNVEVRLTKVEGRLTNVEVRLTKVEGRLTKVEGRLTKVEGRLTKVEGRLTKVEGRLTKVEGRLTKVEGRLTKVEDEVHDAHVLPLLNSAWAIGLKGAQPQSRQSKSTITDGGITDGGKNDPVQSDWKVQLLKLYPHCDGQPHPSHHLAACIPPSLPDDSLLIASLCLRSVLCWPNTGQKLGYGNFIRCMVSHLWLPSRGVVAAHLAQKATASKEGQSLWVLRTAPAAVARAAAHPCVPGCVAALRSACCQCGAELT